MGSSFEFGKIPSLQPLDNIVQTTSHSMTSRVNDYQHPNTGCTYTSQIRFVLKQSVVG